MTTIEKIYNPMPIDVENINSVYVGKPDKCRCGCCGTYTHTKKNQVAAGISRGYPVTDDEVNDAKVIRIVNKMNKNCMIGIEVQDGYIYDMQIGKTVYTVYMMH